MPNRRYFVSNKPVHEQIKSILDDPKLQKEINSVGFGEITFKVRDKTIFNTSTTCSRMTDNILKDKEN